MRLLTNDITLVIVIDVNKETVTSREGKVKMIIMTTAYFKNLLFQRLINYNKEVDMLSRQRVT